MKSGLSPLRHISATASVAVSLLSVPAPAQEASAAKADATELPTFRVDAETLRDDKVQTPFLPASQGPVIYAGKKTTVVDFDAMPQIQTDNYRQAFAKTPGLLTSELSNASLLSLSYRGVGDPHESQNLLVLKDGIPFVLDPFGYPTVYYAPPFESVDRLELIAGGSALLYGPQPSGVLNYVTHAPDRSAPALLSTQHIAGSNNLYSTFSTLEGGVGRVGYQATFDYRSGDSFRAANSDFKVKGGSARFVVDQDANSQWSLEVDAYEADSGEPGGLTFATGAGRLNYNENRVQSQLAHDRVRVDRTAVVLGYTREVADGAVQARVWGSKVSRFSKRENGAGFGTTASGNTTIGSGSSALSFTNSNTITLHEYYTLAGEIRARRDYELLGAEGRATAGLTVMEVESPITSRIGTSRDAESGVRVFRAERESQYAALFAEQSLTWGKLTLVPGVRLDFLKQEIEEQQNWSKSLRATPTALGHQKDDDLTPLVGLGAAYTLPRSSELYANVSTAYKPKTYADAVPTGGTDTVSSDLQAAHVANYEIGLRGRPLTGMWYDASVFLVDYDDRFGRVGSSLQNVGRSQNLGVSLSTEIDVWSISVADQRHTLSWYGNVQYLNAEFVSGPLKGKTPQYAPDVMLRTGLTYRLPGRVKIALMVTHLSDHYADDANTRTAAQDWLIPSYTVLDLTAEVYAWRGKLAGREAAVAVLAGVNNLLDEDYYSRIRSNGIDPAAPRNSYVGVRLEF